jgi:hypothetical protein
VLDLAIGLPALSFVATAENIAALPAQFQGVPALISKFADYLDQLMPNPPIAADPSVTQISASTTQPA